MPVWSKNRHRIALILMLLAPAAACADFTVTEVKPRFQDGALVVSGSMLLELSRKVEEAVSKGIELPLLVEAQLYRERAFWWDERLASWTLHRSLRYHALSGQYIVGANGAYENFLAATDALRQLGAFADLRLPLPDIEPAQDSGYRLRLRARLDIESLPAPLRPVAYTTLSWHLNSGWTSWPIAP